MEPVLTSRPYMPPLEELMPYLERIWKEGRITNIGPIHEEFEEALCRYLDVEHVSLFANGTLALLFALKVLKLRGEIITTSFTSPATSQAIVWNNLKPVYADISEKDLNIDPEKIEKAITPYTSAILPVHVFGTPCEVDSIQSIAEKHRLLVVYDAAHAFAVKLNQIPLCHFGNLSVMSFHATKILSTIEGGAVICPDKETKSIIDRMKMVRHMPGGSDGSGMNAKMNELQAAFGLVHLNHVNELIHHRKTISHLYQKALKDLPGLEIPAIKGGSGQNYSYFPVLIHPQNGGCNRDELAATLEKSFIFCKKYFYPPVHDLEEFRKFKTSDLPVTEALAARILCLPLHHEVNPQHVECIAGIIRETLSRKK
ncbi:MAG: DegT/DnrJ/EryC1/StrS family aminotransferase [Bacteroidetes bacterium]|nr:DegT/DnrJ/EryC1/StrS family aminotransferase [Bacteroidota bacterium]